MIKTPIVLGEWHICTPCLYRFLNKEYVDAFFKDGTLRISSFAQFSKHKDEQRLDCHEGEVHFVEQTKEFGGQTVEIFSKHGGNAYVLSSSMRFDKKLADSFECNSYIKITDTTAFGITIAKHIQNLIAAYEGPCNYQVMKIMAKETNGPPKHIEHYKNDEGLVDVDKLIKSTTSRHAAHAPFFLKDARYSNQVEYRFVWLVNEQVEEPIFIKAPEAVQFCERPNKLTE